MNEDDISIDTESAITSNDQSSDVGGGPEDHIKVCVRIRPLLKDEVLKNNDTVAWTWEDNSITQDNSKSLHARKSTVIGTSGRVSDDQNSLNLAFTFDFLFRPEHSNEYIFQSVIESAAEQAMNGFHGSVFAYGQSGSGKTFSMQGSNSQLGIIPQAIQYCFDSIQSYPDREFLFRVSYLEVYNEQIKDLLTTEPTQIKIQDGGVKIGVIISGVKEQVVLNPEQVMALMKAGEAQRHVGSTDMNDKSSRAHTLFKLTIESTPKERGGGNSNNAVRVSTLSLVDLAGSENAKMTNSVGARAQEAKFINQSLLTLSTIIQRLSEEKPGQARKQHLPYRDSKLTRLMQASLSGNAKIVILCTISPTIRCQDETTNTLKFAARAKKIRMEAHVNETMDDKTLLKVYRLEIEQLKTKLQTLESQSKMLNNNNPSNNVFNENGGGGSGRNLSDDMFDFDVGDDGNKSIMLNMIAEMERLILKADPSKPMGPASPQPSYKNNNSNNNIKNNSNSSNNKSLPPTAHANNSNDTMVILQFPSPSSSSTSSSSLSTPRNATTTTSATSSTTPSALKKPTSLSTTNTTTPPTSALKSSLRPSGLKPPSSISTTPSSSSSSSSSSLSSSVSKSLSSPLSKTVATGSNTNNNNSKSFTNAHQQRCSGTLDEIPAETQSNKSIISMTSSSKSSKSSTTTKASATISTTANNSNASSSTHGNVIFASSSISSTSTSTSSSIATAIVDNSTDNVTNAYEVITDDTLEVVTTSTTSVTLSSPRQQYSHIQIQDSTGSSSGGTVMNSSRHSLTSSRSMDLTNGGNQVLGTVSQMLSMLKLHLTRASNHSNTAASSTKSNANNNNHPLSSINAPQSSDDLEGFYDASQSAKHNSSNNDNSQSAAQIEKLSVDLQLKDADNRFLQDELEKKEQMLSLLTEGLKEVEINQERWLQENESLSRDLETALQENDLLRAQVNTLEKLVEGKDQQLFELGCSGIGMGTTVSGKQCPVKAVWIDSPTGSPRISRHHADVSSSFNDNNAAANNSNSSHDSSSHDDAIVAANSSSSNSTATSGVTAVVTGVMGIAPVSIAAMIFGNCGPTSNVAVAENKVHISDAALDTIRSSNFHDDSSNNNNDSNIYTVTKPSRDAEEY